MAYFPYGGKSIFYEEFGQGSPVLFLHGNTASSKMFELLMPLYAEKFRCILLDFLGNGRSDRVERFSPDLWQEEARQTIALVEYLQCGKVSLVGTSGGAWAAVNAALLRPDLFHAVVADSFDGRTPALPTICWPSGMPQKQTPRPGSSISGARGMIGRLSWTVTQRRCCNARRKTGRFCAGR